jgi:hypothetical protein
LILADQAEKALVQAHDSVRELITGKIPNAEVDALARLLSEGTWTHDHPNVCAKGTRFPFAAVLTRA